MRIQMPDDVRNIIETLEAHGHSAYAVGGCVRDSILGREPNDWDITTAASPADVKKIFRRTVDTGIEHGTVTVMKNQTGYEVTTYRIDGSYTDSRHPDSVEFTSDLSEDLRRRDFTVNAMAYNDRDGLQDLFHGKDDLEKKMIRAVGNPEERFTEDALRIMRCVRFAAQLDFSIDADTYTAAKKLAANLRQISWERIREELLKTLLSRDPEMVRLFEEIGAFSWWYPEFSDGMDTRLALLSKTEPDECMRLSAFFRQENQRGMSDELIEKITAKDEPEHLDSEIADRVMRTLKFDNFTRKKTVAMVSFSHEALKPEKPLLRKLMWRYGDDDFDDFIRFYETAHEKNLRAERALVKEIREKGECISLKTLAVKGEDLKAIGVAPGKEMGEILNQLLQAVLMDSDLNQKAILLKEAEKMKNAKNA